MINHKLGYYRVGEKIHTNKIAALVDGTNRNIHPEWVFNNDVFDVVDWTQEPTASLEELYLARARQIREQYDYVILSYSGGSDSQNILNTFLNNNIRIDEIVSCWPISIVERLEANPWDYRPENQSSEWELRAKPQLEKLSKSHPDIKITIHNWSTGVDNYKIKDGYITDRGIHTGAYSGLRWDYSNIKDVDRALNQRDNSVVIWGACKPRVCFHDGAYRLYFIDLVGSGSVDPANEQRTEYFYWHPDAWQIIAKQAHLIVKFMEANPMFKQFIAWPTPNPRARDFYETAIRAIIYPGMDLNFFQATKWPDFDFAWDTTLFNLGANVEQRLKSINKENYQYLHQVIDPKYFQNNGKTDKLVGFITGMWALTK
jgi:hypothetical protein